jgi:hypothetical protein
MNKQFQILINAQQKLRKCGGGKQKAQRRKQKSVQAFISKKSLLSRYWQAHCETIAEFDRLTNTTPPEETVPSDGRFPSLMNRQVEILLDPCDRVT